MSAPTLDAPHISQTCGLYINSEGDTWVNGESADWTWEATTPDEALCEDTWSRLADHFRNWERSREGGPFSDTKEACWLPASCLTREGKVVGILTTELSSKGNSLVERDDGPDKAELEAAIDRLVAAHTRLDIALRKREWAPGYFYLEAYFGPDSVEDATALCVLLSQKIALDPVLAQAREWIG